MLQQTQVSRVSQKYALFLKRFPSVRALARQPVAGVIRAWQGMGYNGRALRLKECAQQIVKSHQGRVPNDLNALQTLPGIGKYTAHAVACFAFAQRVPVVDVNVQRVLSRVFWKMKSVRDRKVAEPVWEIAHRVLPGKNARSWNQALMDLGATICTSRRPLCGICPVSALCSSAPTLLRSYGKPAPRKLSREKLYRGLPIRIYRGRIVESLRKLNGERRIRLDKLGTLIKPGFVRAESPWLESVLQKLAKDGLVELSKKENNTFVRLPAA